MTDRGGWQPIETAPRDGTAIIGGYFNQPWAESHREGDIARCWFQPEFNAFISSCREMSMHNRWTFEDGSTRKLHSPVIEDVTHWMQLPEPPDAKEKATIGKPGGNEAASDDRLDTHHSGTLSSTFPLDRCL